MPSKIGRTTEYEMSAAVLRHLSHQPGGYASLEELRAATPYHVDLTPGDMQDSSTRPKERLWQQLLRNIYCHSMNPRNFIHRGYMEHIPGGGYAITDKGRDFLEDHDDD